MTKSRNVGRGGRNKIDLSGKKFGRLLVLNDGGRRNRKMLWQCLCDCGTLLLVKSQSLILGTTQSCGCWHNEIVSNQRWKGYKEISRTYWSSVVLCAERRNHQFDITIEQAWDLYLKQNKKCAISGIPIIFSRSFTREARKIQTCSLDRIDSNKGYIIDNVQWVHKDINTMKWDFSMTYFDEMCILVAKQAKKRKQKS